MFVFLQYEDPERQEAARKSVPVDEIEEKALVSLAKVQFFLPFSLLHGLVDLYLDRYCCSRRGWRRHRLVEVTIEVTCKKVSSWDGS